MCHSQTHVWVEGGACCIKKPSLDVWFADKISHSTVEISYGSLRVDFGVFAFAACIQ